MLLGLDIFSKNIFFGGGAGSFRYLNPILFYPHNVHFEILVEYGLFLFIP
jgi:O-antigen ligase